MSNARYATYCSALYSDFPTPLCRDGVSGGTGPRSLSDAAELRSMPKHREGLPFRVSGQLRGRDLLLRPPPQQTQEIHLPMHRWILFCTGGGKGRQVWLHKMSILKTKKKKYIRTPPSFEVPCFVLPFCQCWTNVFFPSKEIMDYCKIKNKPIFYYEAEKKRQKIDFRVFLFFFCHPFRYCDLKSPQTRMENKHAVLTHFTLCLCAILLCGFLNCRNSFHLDFVKVR